MEFNITDSLEYQIGMYIHICGTPIILAFGFVGNILSFITMMQKENRRQPCCWYFAAISVSDNIVLLVTCIIYVQQVMDAQYLLVCELYTYFAHTALATSCYLLLLITMNRYFAVCHILQKTQFMTLRFTRRITIVVVFTMAIIHIPQFFTSSIVERYICAAYSVPILLSKIDAWISIFLFFIFPFLVGTFLNGSIYIRVRGRRKLLNNMRSDVKMPSVCSVDEGQRQEGQDEGMDESRKSSQSSKVVFDAGHSLRMQYHIERELTKMMVVVSSAFVLLCLPQYTRYIVYAFVDNDTSAEAFAIYTLVYQITSKLYIANSAINFYLYCIFGSKFRRDVQKVLQCPVVVKAAREHRMHVRNSLSSTNRC